MNIITDRLGSQLAIGDTVVAEVGSANKTLAVAIIYDLQHTETSTCNKGGSKSTSHYLVRLRNMSEIYYRDHLIRGEVESDSAQFNTIAKLPKDRGVAGLIDEFRGSWKKGSSKE